MYQDILFPKSLNMSLIKEKGLFQEDSLKKYFDLQRKYKTVFELYLNKILDIKKYDNLINNSDLKFSPIEKEKQDIYQLNSNLDSNYIYIKNNFHIEKLSLYDLNILKMETTESKELLNLVIRTYKDIIKIDVINNKSYSGRFKTKYILEFNNEECYAYNDSLVLVLREGNTKYEFDGSKLATILLKKIEYINELKAQIKIDIEKKLDMEVKIIHIIR